MISPYFVPGEAGLNLLTEATRLGKTVRVLTNSLAATDVAAVHGGYSRYRTPLLEAGVHIWELKPLLQTPTETSLFGSSGSSLHTKAMVVDGTVSVFGSANFDNRSLELNDELNIIVEDRALAASLTEDFESDLRKSRRINRDEWRARPLHIRGRERLWSFFGEIF